MVGASGTVPRSVLLLKGCCKRSGAGGFRKVSGSSCHAMMSEVLRWYAERRSASSCSQRGSFNDSWTHLPLQRTSAQVVEPTLELVILLVSAMDQPD